VSTLQHNANTAVAVAAVRVLGLHAAGLHDVGAPMAAAASAGLAMFLWGFATWWLLLALASVGTCLRKGIPFNLGWWGAIFPMGKLFEGVCGMSMLEWIWLYLTEVRHVTAVAAEL
jgi:tellurite resistance protein TehA-like permease